MESNECQCHGCESGRKMEHENNILILVNRDEHLRLWKQAQVLIQLKEWLMENIWAPVYQVLDKIKELQGEL